jgi:hypothetical protein
MNYQRIYNQIIDRAKKRELEGYKERHHIIPKCMGGSNKKENLVELTAREHYICHLLLCRIHPNSQKLIYALTSMIFLNNSKQQRYFPSSRVIEQIKCLSSETKKQTCWVHRGCVRKKINKEDLLTYLADGYTQGRGLAYNKGKVSMVFNEKTYYVDASEVEVNLSKGYTLGSTNRGKKQKGEHPGKNRICVCREAETKRVRKEDLEQYLKEGWKRGYHYKIDYTLRKNYRLYERKRVE